jgi:hypothetical protein
MYELLPVDDFLKQERMTRSQTRSSEWKRSAGQWNFVGDNDGPTTSADIPRLMEQIRRQSFHHDSNSAQHQQQQQQQHQPNNETGIMNDCHDKFASNIDEMQDSIGFNNRLHCSSHNEQPLPVHDDHHHSIMLENRWSSNGNAQSRNNNVQHTHDSFDADHQNSHVSQVYHAEIMTSSSGHSHVVDNNQTLLMNEQHEGQLIQQDQLVDETTNTRQEAHGGLCSTDVTVEIDICSDYNFMRGVKYLQFISECMGGGGGGEIRSALDRVIVEAEKHMRTTRPASFFKRIKL